MSIINPDREREGYQFKCDNCQKYWEMKGGKHQEITDRLKTENIPENRSSNSLYCNDCFSEISEGGLEPPSISRP